MRTLALWCLLALAALPALQAVHAERVIPHEDLSLLDLTMQLPSDPSEAGEGMSAAAVAKLHAAAGSEADEAIAEAERQSMLMETDSIAAASGPSKWDASVPEVHLKTATRPEEVLSTELETVEHLDHSRSWMTAELTAPQQLMAAFPKASPAILGEDHSFVQQQAQQTAQAAVQVQAAAQVAGQSHSASASEGESEGGALTEAEAAAGVMTMADLQQMMELEGYSQQEIDQYMESLGENTVEVVADAETEGEAEAETEVEAEAETEADAAVEAETEQEAGAEAEAETDVTAETEAAAETEGEAAAEGEAATQVEATAEELAFYEKDAAESGIPAIELLEIERRAQAEEEARLAKEAEEQAQQAQAEQTTEEPALVEQSAEAAGASDTDAETEGEQEAVMASDMDAAAQTDAEVEAEAQAEAEQQQGAEDMIHLQEHEQPAVLQESAPSTVTPMHSRAYNKRHPTLSKIAASAASSGYSLPQASLVETGSRARAQSYQRSGEVDTERFNPSAVQLGPSKDLYGYVPMTGAEFLHSPQQPASLAQVSMQLQNQGKTWLPPPIEAQAAPAFVVGMGGLMPNRNAGPYQGQYALAAGPQPMPQQPAFIQY